MLTVVFGEVSGAAPIANSRRIGRSTSIVPESMNLPEQQIFSLKSEAMRRMRRKNLRRGEGLAKDGEKAADLYLETFNRVLYCCWAPVARHILAEVNQHDKTAVRRVVGELTRWAAVLDSQTARDVLAELDANGTLALADPLPPAKFTDLPPWFR